MSSEGNVIIKPATITTSVTVTSFNVSCRSLEMFKSASFTVNTFDTDNKFVNRQIITLTQEQYNEWNSNDSYIINLVASELGFVIVGPPK